MPTPIQIKNSATYNSEPTTDDIIEAELAVNTADRKLFTRDANDTIIELTSRDLQRPGVVNSAATSYTVDETDENKIIIITNASAIAATLPLEATTSLPIGYICHFHQGGAGSITVAGEVGVTVNSSRSLVTANQYAALSAFKVAADAWLVVGDQQ